MKTIWANQFLLVVPISIVDPSSYRLDSTDTSYFWLLKIGSPVADSLLRTSDFTPSRGIPWSIGSYPLSLSPYLSCLFYPFWLLNIRNSGLSGLTGLASFGSDSHSAYESRHGSSPLGGDLFFIHPFQPFPAGFDTTLREGGESGISLPYR